MPLGIDPTIDYVFKKIFGDPENSDVLIHLLNSVIEPRSLITAVEIQSPFLEKEFEDDKYSILDLKARDSDGRWFNVEMQTTIPAGLSERLVYYASCLFADQLGEGEQYSRLNPVISICFLTRILFSDVPTEHLRFTLSDRRYNVELTEHFQVHTVELPKYNLDEATLRAAPDLAKWAFFLKMAPHLDAVRLRKLLAEAPYQKAIGIVEMISRTPEQRRIHDARQKAIRDQAWILEGTREAAIQEGRKEGIEAGRQEGIEAGRQEGRQEGIELGIQRGDRRGKIHLLQQLLGEALTSDEVLSRLELAEMDAMIAGLLTRVAKPGDVGSP